MIQMFPTGLPAEIKLHLLSYLPLSTLSKLLGVNRDWYDFIDGNEMNRETIYREAAFLEGYTPSPLLAFEKVVAIDGGQQVEPRTALYSRRAMMGVLNWKEFCKRRKTIERAWAGRASSRVVPSPHALSSLGETRRQELTPDSSHYNRVLRFKVDEKVGITMATTELGGLIVRDLETDAVLWELPVSYVRGYSHLEYGEGFMIFDRDDGNKEVWRRTADIPDPSPITSHIAATHPRPQTEPEFEVDLASSPDRRQREVMNSISHLTTPSPSSAPPVSTPSTKPPNFKAHFTPHAILHPPEPTSAFRFVYPHLLMVSLERAFVWDVRTGKMLETFNGIQAIYPGVDEYQGNHHASNPFPLFLDRVRYVDISSRHIFLAGGNLLRIFSRATKECVLDIPSTKLRYGRWKWEVASRALNIGVGIGQARQGTRGDGSEEKGSYTVAKEMGREVVRMPTMFSSEEYSSAISGERLIGQFIAVHVSSDGKHIVALLNGSRLVIIHHFEAILANCRPPPALGPLPLSSISGSDSQPILQHQKSKNKSSAARRRHERHVRHEADQERRRERDEKQEEIFNNALDVQLGSPFSSSSVYLTYEDGRIGVVTSNAVYIVIPTIPSSPSLTASNVGAAPLSPNGPAHQPKFHYPKPPELSILRIPYFANPSWLSQVSCLMMSDTGLYLNWDPTWPRGQPTLGRGATVLATGHAAGPAAGIGGVTPNLGVAFELGNEEERERRERMVSRWESEYERDLKDYNLTKDKKYHVFPNGDMFVAPVPRDFFEESEVSTIYRVDFAPLPSSPISTSHASVSASQQVTTDDGGLAQAGSSTAGAGSQRRKRKGNAKKRVTK